MSSDASVVPGGLPDYRLKSDLAQYCLPSASRDDSRKVAWANAICLMFLTVATIGLWQPVFVLREAEPLPEPTPIVILPPPVEQEPQTIVAKTEDQPDEPTLDKVEMPVVAPVLVAAPSDVSFSVPIEGYVAISKDVRAVPPPPAVIPKAPPPDNLPKPEFRNIRIGAKEFKKMPPPNYPPEFERNRMNGVAIIEFTVDTNGVPTTVEIGKSSGVPAIDRHLTDFIKREWRAFPGEGGRFRVMTGFAPR